MAAAKSKRTNQTMGIVTDVTIVDGGYDVEVDMGGMLVTAEHTGSPAFEDPPLPGDEAYLQRGEGNGTWTIVGYGRTNTPTAQPGELRLPGRDASGKQVAEIYVRNDGTVVINGVEFSPTGAITAPGEVTAQSSSVPIALSTHIHPHPMGPTSGPQSPPSP